MPSKSKNEFWRAFEGWAVVFDNKVKLTRKGSLALLPRLGAQGLAWPASVSCEQAAEIYAELLKREAWSRLQQLADKAHTLSPENQEFLKAVLSVNSDVAKAVKIRDNVVSVPFGRKPAG